MDKAETEALDRARSILSPKDTGQATCVLRELRRDHRASPAEDLLAFGSDDDSERDLDTVLKLRDQVLAAMEDDGVRRGMAASAVSHYIFYTNKIEFLSTETEGDTMALIQKQKAALGLKEKLVMSMLELLQLTYKPGRAVEETVFSSQQLIYWLRTLSSSDKAGFRTSGCYAESFDGSTHVYPHNGIVAAAIESLTDILPSMAKYVASLVGEREKVAAVFRMAAFAQFHVVDIHPFADGNGRVCRFVSKYVLDSVLPLPVAMFTDRPAYMDALKQGRLCAPAQAPAFLYQRLLKATIGTYTHLLRVFEHTPTYDVLIMAQNTRLAEELCTRQLRDEEDRRAVLDWFKAALAAEEEKEEELVLPSGSVCKVMAEVDWDYVRDNL